MRVEREPQGLKPRFDGALMARLKPCPSTALPTAIYEIASSDFLERCFLKRCLSRTAFIARLWKRCAIRRFILRSTAAVMEDEKAGSSPGVPPGSE